MSPAPDSGLAVILRTESLPEARVVVQILEGAGIRTVANNLGKHDQLPHLAENMFRKDPIVIRVAQGDRKEAERLLEAARRAGGDDGEPST